MSNPKTFLKNSYCSMSYNTSSLYSQVLAIVRTEAISTTGISVKLKQKRISGLLRLVLAKLEQDKLIE